jgi:hypothetical protein
MGIFSCFSGGSGSKQTPAKPEEQALRGLLSRTSLNDLKAKSKPQNIVILRDTVTVEQALQARRLRGFWSRSW